MKNTKKKGFTIVELVIVIAVIGILSAILIPTFSNLVKNANNAKLQADLRNAYTEYASYAAETPDKLHGQEEVVFMKSTSAQTRYYVYSNGKYISGEAADISSTQFTFDILGTADTSDDVELFNGYYAFLKSTGSGS